MWILFVVLLFQGLCMLFFYLRVLCRKGFSSDCFCKWSLLIWIYYLYHIWYYCFWNVLLCIILFPIFVIVFIGHIFWYIIFLYFVCLHWQCPWAHSTFCWMMSEELLFCVVAGDLNYVVLWNLFFVAFGVWCTVIVLCFCKSTVYVGLTDFFKYQFHL